MQKSNEPARKCSPLVSVIIPMRNEEKYAERCINSVLNNKYPKERLEILCIDGMSDDNTLQILESISSHTSNVKVYANPKRIFPAAVNIGICNSTGSFVAILGAHAKYDPFYIDNCVNYLLEYQVDNVGGALITLPSSANLTSTAISIAISHKFGVGNSSFRIGVKSPILVDTVFGGFYRKEIFNQIGLFNEKLVKGSDIDLNYRLVQSGGKILIAPKIKAYYYSDDSFIESWKHNFKDGFGVYYRMVHGSKPFILRHFIAPASLLIGTLGIIFSFFSIFAAATILILIGAYGLTNLYFSIKIAINRRQPRLILAMPLAFWIRHCAYGLGSIKGLTKIIFMIKKNK